MKVDKKLNSNAYVEGLHKKASQKILALAAPYMSVVKKHMLVNAFFKSQFSYCPLEWMFTKIFKVSKYIAPKV